MTRGRTMSAVAVAAVLGAVTWGVVTLGGPREERIRRFDQRRVEDLRRLGRSIDAFAIRNKRLPASIQEVVTSLQDTRWRARLVHQENVHDPTTDQPYGYRVGVGLRYELCASFQGPSGEDSVNRRFGAFWSHPAGAHCYALDAQEAMDKKAR